MLGELLIVPYRPPTRPLHSSTIGPLLRDIFRFFSLGTPLNKQCYPLTTLEHLRS